MDIKTITKYELASILGKKIRILKKLTQEIDDLMWLLVGKS